MAKKIAAFEKLKASSAKPRKENPRRTITNFAVQTPRPMTASKSARAAADAAFGSGYIMGAKKNNSVKVDSPLSAPKSVRIKDTKATTAKRGVKKTTTKAKGAMAQKAKVTKSASQIKAATKAGKLRAKGKDAMKAGNLSKARRLSRRYQRQKGKM